MVSTSLVHIQIPSPLAHTESPIQLTPPSGKSTLMLLLLRYMRPTGGSIEVDGIPIAQVPCHIVREQCFIAVPQDPFIFAHCSLRYNIDVSAAQPPTPSQTN